MKAFSFSLLISLFFFPLLCQGSPFQLFLEPQTEAACSTPLDITVYVLSEEGRVVTSFEGERIVSVSGDVTQTQRVSFQKGEGVVTFAVDEPGEVMVQVAVDAVTLPGHLQLDFQDRDVTSPTIDSILVEKADLIILKFNEEVQLEEASEPNNYTATTGKREVHPDRVEYHNDYVILRFAHAFDEDEQGYMSVRNIKDLAGNEVEPDTRSPDFTGDCGCDH